MAVSNPASAVSMIQLLQYFEMLNLINVKKLPLNFKAFMEFFSQNLFDMVPNFIEVDENLDLTESRLVRTARRTL